MARRLLSLTLVCAALVSCLSDLPPATTCPSEPRRSIATCLQVLERSAPVPGCQSKASTVHECILGPRADCACEPSECPASSSACFPPPDCPPLVRKTAPSATCPKPGLAQVSPGCVCGCPTCLSVCDGYGPSVAVVIPPGQAAMPLLTVPLEGLPSSGKLGFYVRLRGAATIAAGVVIGSAPMVTQPIDFQDFPAGDPAFREVIVAPEKIAWASADQAPVSIFLAATPGSSATEPGITYAQIDCIVPIVTR